MKRADIPKSNTDSKTQRAEAGAPSVRDHPMRLFRGGDADSHQFRVVAFDLDAASKVSLQEALPGWEIDVIHDAAAAPHPPIWNAPTTDLLVVTIGADTERSLALCRYLSGRSGFSNEGQNNKGNEERLNRNERDQAPRDGAPLLVLVLPGQEHLISAALQAGAQTCLVLPIRPNDVTTMIARARHGNQPGRHTLNLDQAQVEDRWRDDGGQG